ncbi:RIB43A domain with coiled-coils 1 L homeolog isoform X3 [Xenopus laevis]|nr:RIB43A domain with coiled-coils 1 L homeolog isoform X3 [Xenopus laevis]
MARSVRVGSVRKTKIPFEHFSNSEAVDKISAGLRLFRPKMSPERVYMLMKNCRQQAGRSKRGGGTCASAAGRTSAWPPMTTPDMDLHTAVLPAGPTLQRTDLVPAPPSSKLLGQLIFICASPDMHKVDLLPDPKEIAATERRRNQEQQRQSRIFNAKCRTIGVDVQTLDRQVQELKLKERAEKASDEAYDAESLLNDKIAQILEHRQEQLAQTLEKAVQDFRNQLQQPHTRREFDLYDPKALKKDQPARVGDEDPRCGLASLQKFTGEDLNEKERKKMQMDLTKKWFSEQLEERKRMQHQAKYADHLNDKKRVELDERALNLSSMEEECRKAINLATKNYNEALALEASEHKRLRNQQEQDDNFAEIFNHLTGDILTENPAAASSSYGPHRVIPDRWKGMSPEQLQAIRETQDQQCQEKQRLNEQDKQLETEWAHQRVLAARAAMTLEQQEMEMNKELRKRLDLYNQQLSKEQKAHLEYLEKEVYTNNPTAHYYTQFNTTSR